MLYHFETAQWIPVAIDAVFRFFANPENLPRIMPPASGTRFLHKTTVSPAHGLSQNSEPIVGAGSEIVTSFRVIPYLPFRRKWIARITEFEWNHHFADVQEEGPFKSFHHRHELMPEARSNRPGTVIRDAIDYEIGLGPLDPIANLFVSRQLHKTFAYRQAAVEAILLRS